jgi:hypothetical protein
MRFQIKSAARASRDVMGDLFGANAVVERAFRLDAAQDVA